MTFALLAPLFLGYQVPHLPFTASARAQQQLLLSPQCLECGAARRHSPTIMAGGASLLDTLARRGTEDEIVVSNAFYNPAANDAAVDKYRERVERINALEDEIEELDDDALAAKTAEFRSRLAGGATLEDLLEEAFAVVREAAWRTLELRHYDVQLMGAMALHDGKLAQMGTGEGKTLANTAAVYLNALSGKGAHLVTVNDYLARRDAEQMGQVYSFLGLSVGLVQANMPTDQVSRRSLPRPSLDPPLSRGPPFESPQAPMDRSRPPSMPPDSPNLACPPSSGARRTAAT